MPDPAPAQTPDAPRRIALTIFCSSLDEGGAERVVVTLLKRIDRERFDPTLVLARKVGVWVEHVPDDVPVVDLGAARLRKAVGALARYLRRERPDVLFTVSSGPNLIGALANRLAPDPARRLILSERNTFSVFREARRPKWLPIRTVSRWLYHQADRILAVSDGVADDLTAYLGLPEENVIAVYNPIVDESLEQLAAEPIDHPWFGGEVPVVLAVGRLVPQKDYPTLLRAFAEVRRTRPARLVVLSGGAHRPDLETLATELGIGDDVDFAGFKLNPFSYMRACDVYVLSSLFEGLPGALIQALACGAPAVSTDCPSGPNEIVKPGENGFLVPVGDVSALGNAIVRLLDDDDLRTRFSARAPGSVARFGVQEAIRR